ncbi:MAG: hypothetical protein A49_07840 [Methyloceanibacter sp.]|nr:MAG: hypothetical protein A49_07840 [Methyloceanibacter sp.]
MVAVGEPGVPVTTCAAAAVGQIATAIPNAKTDLRMSRIRIVLHSCLARAGRRPSSKEGACTMAAAGTSFRPIEIDIHANARPRPADRFRERF